MYVGPSGETTTSRTSWELWFAWYPVRITATYKLTWLRNVGRRTCTREMRLEPKSEWWYVDHEKEYCAKVDMFFDKIKDD